jgi:hypothetical protein
MALIAPNPVPVLVLDGRTRLRRAAPWPRIPRFVVVEVREEGADMAATTRTRIHRGAIRICSEPGKGTSIQRHVPASASPVQAAALSSAQRWIGEGDVLIVDDEPGARP